MIEIPHQPNTHNLKVLVIDDSTLVHNQIQQALLGLGITQVKCAENAFYALRLCEEIRFDIVLIAFNLKNDVDGFHLFEEMKFKNYINKQTSVVFLSAETSEALVNCIIELQPDDFWVKPLDKKRLEVRLRHLLGIRRKLYKLHYCVDQKAYSAAIYHAERQLVDASMEEYHPRIQRVIGDCLGELHEFVDMQAHFQRLSEQYNYAWVHIGLARSLLKQGEKAQAEQLIEQMLNRDDTRFATYDMLAQYYIEQEEYDKAYQQIQQATRLAPRNIERNKRSWDLARLNNDREGQLAATQNMSKYAKNSIHDSPELSLNVIRASIDLANSKSGQEANQLLTQAEKKIKDLSASAEKDATLKEQLVVAQVRLLNARDEKKSADKLLKEDSRKHISANIEDNIDKVKAYHELGHKELALSMLKGIGDQLAGGSFSSKVLANYVEQESLQRKEILFTPSQLRQMAAENFRKKRIQPAYQNLKQAFTLTPMSKQVALSLLKVLVQLKKHQALQQEHYDIAHKSLVLLDDSDLPMELQQKRDSYAKELAIQLDP